MKQNLSNRTIGVEFEMYFIPKKFVELYPQYKENFAAGDTEEYEMSYNSINSFLVENGFSGWEAKPDGSLEQEELKNYQVFSLEVVTPPIYWDTAKTEIPRFCSIFKQFCISEHPDTGLHVHVDVADLLAGTADKKQRLEIILLMLLKYKSIEPIFDQFVAKHRQKNRNAEYAGTTQISGLLDRYNNAVKVISQDFDYLVNRVQDSRYKKLNILSLLKYGTIEFRQHEGTLNSNRILIWIANCINFVNSIDITNKIFLSYLKEFNSIIENPKIYTMPTPEKEEEKRKFNLKISSYNKSYREMIASLFRGSVDSVRNLVNSDLLFELVFSRINEFLKEKTNNFLRIAPKSYDFIISFDEIAPAFTNPEQGLYRLATGNVQPGSTMKGLAIDKFVRTFKDKLSDFGFVVQTSDKKMLIQFFGEKPYRRNIQILQDDFEEKTKDRPRTLGKHASAIKAAKNISKDYQYQPITSIDENKNRL